MSRVAILVDPLSGQDPRSQERAVAQAAALGDQAQIHLCSGPEQLSRAVAQAQQAQIIGVTGGDAGVSAVITALWRRGGFQGHLLPMGGGRWDLLRRDLGAAALEPLEVAARLARWLRRGRGLLRPGPASGQRTCLRLVDSARPHAHLGFSLGLGALADAGAQSGLRASLQALSRQARASVVEPARVVADQQPVLDRFHALAASSLGQQLAGVRSLALPAPGGFHLSWSQGTVGVAALALPTGPTSGPQHGLRQVQRAVLDLPSGAGYCFDGEEATPTPGGLALEVTPGPAVNFYFWR